MDKRTITQRIWGIIEPVLGQHGYELIEVAFAQEGSRFILRIFIDAEGGITLDDCASATQLLNPVLDEAEPIEGSYYLELSSPGIDRPVRKEADFIRFRGEPVRLRSVAPVRGRKKFTGTLVDFRDGLIVLDCDGDTYEVHIENLDRANLNR